MPMKENTMRTNEMVQYVGADIRKDSIVLAVPRDDEQQPRTAIKKPNERRVIRKYLEKLKERGDAACCYEAGPRGYHLQRKPIELGIACIISARG